jgi:starvation-inducible DNA-binding protein
MYIMKVNIGLTSEDIAKSLVLLNGLLADHFTLLLKTWQFHWNVIGSSFGSYHEAMLKLYEAEIERVDGVAERVRALGGRPLGSMEAMLQANHIQEYEMSQPLPTNMEMWKIISADWDTVIRRIREIHDQVPPADQGTLNFLEDMIESMEKEAWMNRSYNEMR